jgi:hypothetical protein
MAHPLFCMGAVALFAGGGVWGKIDLAAEEAGEQDTEMMWTLDLATRYLWKYR